MRYPLEPLVDYQPAKKKRFEKRMNARGGEGVTLQMVPLTREKKNLMKKIGIDRGAGSLEADSERKKKKKNAIRTRNRRDREKRKREKQRKKKKDGKERNLQR